tara:strand:- start:169 stop:621 length:453 start_codon:yes stop_codon:yes gene_type:complete
MLTQEMYREIIENQIPIAWMAGVRLESFGLEETKLYVVLDKMNQNPFKSMFWAVQGMAAEFAGGLMVNVKTRMSGKDFSMLVVAQESVFTKKALGKITFTCSDGGLIDEKLKTAIATNESQTMVLTSTGVDEEGDQVAQFKFTWSVKVKG